MSNEPYEHDKYTCSQNIFKHIETEIIFLSLKVPAVCIHVVERQRDVTRSLDEKRPQF